MAGRSGPSSPPRVRWTHASLSGAVPAGHSAWTSSAGDAEGSCVPAIATRSGESGRPAPNARNTSDAAAAQTHLTRDRLPDRAAHSRFVVLKATMPSIKENLTSLFDAERKARGLH